MMDFLERRSVHDTYGNPFCALTTGASTVWVQPQGSASRRVATPSVGHSASPLLLLSNSTNSENGNGRGVAFSEGGVVTGPEWKGSIRGVESLQFLERPPSQAGSRTHGLGSL